jgi:TRAP-type C4-dicarboxylate transport system permease large subunit
MAKLPWLVPLFVALIIITYIPEVTLWLPRAVGVGRH